RIRAVSARLPMLSAFGFSERNQVGQELVRAVGAGGQLAPQAETKIHPPPSAIVRRDQGAGLRSWIVGEVILELNQVLVARVLLAQEVEPAFLYPVLPGCLADLVGRREDRIVRVEDLRYRELVGHAVRADLRRVRAVLSFVEFELVVLHDQ